MCSSDSRAVAVPSCAANGRAVRETCQRLERRSLCIGNDTVVVATPGSEKRSLTCRVRERKCDDVSAFPDVGSYAWNVNE